MFAPIRHRTDAHIEGMRLDDDAVAAQIVLLRREFEAVDPPAETVKFNPEIDIGRGDRLVRPVGIDSELRIGAILEDGDFQREIIVAEHPAAMGTAFIFLIRRDFMTVTMAGRRRIVAARNQHECCERRQQAADKGMSHG